MKDKMTNTITLSGKLFSKNLKTYEVKKQGDNFGKEFIKGTISIATDPEDCLNVVPVNYLFELPTNSRSGTPNSKYEALKKIMEEPCTVEEVGAEQAPLIQITNSTLATEDRYSVQRKEPYSVTNAQGGFIKTINAMPSGDSADKINEFNVDCVITGTTYVEADEEKGIDEPYLFVNAYVFTFKKEIQPVRFTLRNTEGVDYMQSLDISSSNPIFAKVWGTICNTTIKIRKEEESAWGAPKVTYTESTKREFLITGMNPNGEPFGEETTITAEEFKKCMQDREVVLAEVQKNAEEYAATKNAPAKMTSAPAPSIPVKKSDFNF